MNMSAASPDNSKNTGSKALTPLQRHVAFFDQDLNGVIWPSETYKGFKQLHFNFIISAISAFLIHSGLSYLTSKSWIPDPFLRISVSNIKGGVHGSDSGIYDRQGQFDEHRFEEMFDRYTEAPHSHMTFKQGVKMVKGNKDPFDFFGAGAGILEWLFTWFMLGKQQPEGMKREDVKGIYDGTIFYKVSGRKLPSNNASSLFKEKRD